jgi:hypothetical protein
MTPPDGGLFMDCCASCVPLRGLPTLSLYVRSYGGTTGPAAQAQAYKVCMRSSNRGTFCREARWILVEFRTQNATKRTDNPRASATSLVANPQDICGTISHLVEALLQDH